MNHGKEALRAAVDDVFEDEILKAVATRKVSLQTPELYNENKLPVDIIQFVEDPEYLGGQVDLQPAVKDVLWAIEDPAIREADLELGKGSGKSEVSSISTVFGAYQLTWMRNPHQFFGVSPTTFLASANVSTGREQARQVVFESIRGKIMASPYFQKLGVNVLTGELELPNRIRIYCGSSASTAFLGFGTIRGVMDEVNYMVDNSNRNVAKQLYDMLHGSMKTRFPDHYKLVSVSSVTGPTTWLRRRMQQTEKDGDVYAGLVRGLRVQGEVPGIVRLRSATQAPPEWVERTLRDKNGLVLKGLWPWRADGREYVAEAEVVRV